MNTRISAVEGRFYPGSSEETSALISKIEDTQRYALPKIKFEEIIGAVIPHAGHIFSGYQTVPFFKYLAHKKICPETCIILNPNHSGWGPPIALDENDRWENDTGIMEIDTELASMISFPKDARAHQNEHSAEVIIPFIQYYLGDKNLRILPVSMSTRSAKQAILLANELHEAVIALRRNVIVVASSDFSHFLSPEEGFRKDQMVLERLIKRDIEGIEEVVSKHDISVCGTGPIMTLMAYSEKITKEYKAEIIARGHSGEVSPSNEVVDYISIIFYR